MAQISHATKLTAHWFPRETSEHLNAFPENRNDWGLSLFLSFLMVSCQLCVVSFS